MPDPSLFFRIGTLIAVAGWLALLTGLLAPSVRHAAIQLARLIIPTLLALAYAPLILFGFEESAGGGFGSIEQVRALFASDAALAAGWLHYLAFDLFVGSWEVEDSRASRVHAWLVVPCLGLTFLFGPLGLLLYLILRLAFRRRSPVQESLS
jgi:hypothetical protein